MTSNYRTVGPDSEIEFLMLPTRAYTVLRRAGFDKIRDILGHSPESLRRVRGIGEGCALWIEHSLKRNGFEYHPHAHR